jgi:hypothetical protein
MALVCVCMMAVCLSVCLFTCLSFCLSSRLLTHLSVHLSAWLHVRRSIPHLFITLSVYLSDQLLWLDRSLSLMNSVFADYPVGGCLWLSRLALEVKQWAEGTTPPMCHLALFPSTPPPQTTTTTTWEQTRRWLTAATKLVWTWFDFSDWFNFDCMCVWVSVGYWEPYLWVTQLKEEII